MNIGHAVRVARAARGININTLARKATIGASMLSLVEHGKRQPSLEVIERIAAALGIPMAFLMLLASDERTIAALPADTCVAVMQWMRRRT